MFRVCESVCVHDTSSPEPGSTLPGKSLKGGGSGHLWVVQQRLPTVFHVEVGRLLVALPGVVVEGEQSRHLGQPARLVRLQLGLQLLQVLGGD